jgi:hypothetical protein
VINEEGKRFNQLANSLALLLVVIAAISSCRRWETEPKGGGEGDDRECSGRRGSTSERCGRRRGSLESWGT